LPANASERFPGKLMVVEYEAMNTHTVIGANLFAGSHRFVLQMAELIPRCYHVLIGERLRPRNAYCARLTGFLRLR
jgi:hypothetical protein